MLQIGFLKTEVSQQASSQRSSKLVRLLEGLKASLVAVAKPVVVVVSCESPEVEAQEIVK